MLGGWFLGVWFGPQGTPGLQRRRIDNFDLSIFLGFVFIRVVSSPSQAPSFPLRTGRCLWLAFFIPLARGDSR